jgi:hypothetical protein
MRDVSEMASADLSDAQAALVLRGCLEAFREVRFTVTGRCMEPALVEGESVVVAAPTRASARLGDVVLVQQADGLRLHRVIWAFGGQLRTKGDRSPRWDPTLTRSAILGTVVAVGDTGRPRPMRDPWRALVSLARGMAARLREYVPGRLQA